eukprot:g7846.t1
MSLTLLNSTRIYSSLQFSPVIRSSSFARVRKKHVTRRYRYISTKSVLDSTDEQSSKNELGTVYSKWLELIRSTTQQQWTGLLELMRIHNVLPSCLLVFVGALKASGLSSISILVSLRVWIMASISAGVAVASVIVNDYFDFISGVDSVNEPTKPLPSGVIRPDYALLITLVLYVGVLVVGCVMEPPLLRGIIAFSVASTLIYTPLLKSLTLIKNFFVASVIALSPLSGALAAGVGKTGFGALKNATIFIFGSIVFREILMDIKDVEGDSLAHVNTLPVVLGKEPSLILAFAFLATGCVCGGFRILHGPAFNYLLRFMSSVNAKWVAMIPYTLVVSWMCSTALNVWRSKFSKAVLEKSIIQMMFQITVGFLLIVFMG